MRAFFSRLIALALLSTVFAAECTVDHNDDGSDDTEHILKAFSDCKENSVITFQAANYSAYTPASFEGLKNVTIHLEGNLLLPNNISAVQLAINETENQVSTYATPWFYFSGQDVQLIGSNDDEWGKFHGFGQQWWDIGNRTLRPQLATFNVTNGLLRSLKVVKPVAWGWNLPGKNIRVENHFVDAQPNNGTRDDTTSFPFNTYGINVSGHNITIDGYYGHNGDDCISVINGARDVVAQNGFCGFSSHGLSIGSLGKNGANQTVENVLFKNWTMQGAVYGARFKSWTGGNGHATNITWEDIQVDGVSTPIFVTQNYYDQDKGARPENTNQTSTHISGFTFKNFNGTLASNWTDGTCITNPCWNYVDGIDGTQAVIFDLFPGTALDITVEDVNIQGSNISVLCDPSALADGEQKTLGFECRNGAFKESEIEGSSDEDSAMAVTLAASVSMLALITTVVVMGL
ncbi:glycoside hydrolase family 28 protein [Cylindrobasidium torrendii FP15055 ss-10]|uniref:galacturonan 1,4-alpha-galacturonidase n=1 Tax=Cylindrobasidium torrendii FP15055 ss-10 TaxID=1314674 RepID=A0A0D7AUT6_9AGAR|nr:glycoside hydrolase family 28 protein [Cylindrobasidium torrendii FP15055 ss-10]